MNFENELKIGIGIYSTAEISRILRVPGHKVRRWISTYWDGQLGKEFQNRYSWETDNSKAVSFHTLIEFYVMMKLAEKGVSTKQVLKAHKDLSKLKNTPFPFASKEVLGAMNTDGKRVYFKINNDIISLDGTGQFNMEVIHMFFRNLDFGDGDLASSFWPLGKDKSILVDPERKFGHPVLSDVNVYPETIYNHIKAGDPVAYIAHVYELTEKQVADAIEYCDAA